MILFYIPILYAYITSVNDLFLQQMQYNVFNRFFKVVRGLHPQTHLTPWM